MFERFTAAARLAVVQAQEHARQAGAPEVGEEHLLLALAGQRGEIAWALLAARAPAIDALTAEFDRIRRRGGITDGDAEALGALGIDVDRVLDAVEETHGEGALGDQKPVPARRRPWPLRMSASHLPFSDQAKQALEQSLKEALALGDRELGTEHVLLALLQGRGVVAEVLDRHGLGYLDVRAALAHRRAG
jgi:ATP-dependent Clp protease ATP-binding subunit ClpA